MKNNNFFVNIALSVFTLFLGLVLIESAARLRQWVKYGTVNHYVGGEKVWDAGSGLMVHPGGLKTWTISLDSHGFRNPEIESPKPENTVRLAFLGSSATYCSETSSDEKSWPYLVWSALQKAYPGFKIDFINAAVPGFTVLSNLINLEKRIRPFKPDIIIIYEGFNDIILDTGKLVVRGGKLAPSLKNETWIETKLLFWHLIKKNIDFFSRQNRAKQEKAGANFRPEEASERFRLRLRRLIISAKKESSVVAIATLSYKIRREQSEEKKMNSASSAFYYMPYMDLSGMLAVYEEYNRVIRQVAKENQVILIENELSIPGEDEYFKDSIHFSDEGCVFMARRIIKGLMDSPEFRYFMKTRAAK